MLKPVGLSPDLLLNVANRLCIAVFRCRCGMLAWLFVIFSTGQLQSQTISAKLDTFITQQVRECQLKGLSVGIIRNERVIYEKKFGTDTLSGLHYLGNISQPFTALLAMKLSDSGLLDIDQPVIRYLPWFRLRDSISDRITVRHLLNHASGIPLKYSFLDPEWQDSIRIKGAFAAKLSKIRLDHDPGEDYTYSALNYKLLGLILEQVSGKPFDVLQQELISNPLGLTNTVALTESGASGKLKKGNYYSWLWSSPAGNESHSRGAIPSTYIASDVPDMLVFLRQMIRSAEADSTAVLCSPSGMQDILSPFNTSSYGMGWSVDNWEGERMFFQQGLTKHYSSFTCFIPEEALGIVLLSNINNLTSLEQINDGILRILHRKKLPQYLTTEKYFRLGIFIIIGLSLLQFFGRLLRWSIQRWNFKIRWNYSNTSFFVVGTLFTMIWLYIIPNYFQLPIGALIALQPDMGISLVMGVALGSINTFLQLIIRSNIHKHVKKRKQTV